MTNEEFTDVKNDTKRLYLVGEIHYRDAFKRSRVTKYRFEFGGDHLLGLWRMATSKNGNEAT